MAQFTVKVEQTRAQADNEQRMAEDLQEFADSVRRIADELNFSTSSKEEIRAKLKAAAEEATEQQKALSKMSKALTDIMEYYEETEERLILGNSRVSWVGVADQALGYIYKGFASPVSGPLGTLIDLVHSDMEGKTGKEISDLIKLAGGGIKNWKGSGIDWKNWFGLNLLTKSSWESAIGKYTDFSSVKSGFSTACNWASTIVERGFANYDEFGNFQTRFWEETAAETGFKIIESVGATAIAATVLGAAAPAVAVGAAAAVVTVAADAGLNALVRWKTKDPEAEWIEVASDWVCDTAEKVGKEIKREVDDLADDIKKTAKSVKESLIKGVNAVKNSVGSSCRWGKLLPC